MFFSGGAGRGAGWSAAKCIVVVPLMLRRNHTKAITSHCPPPTYPVLISELVASVAVPLERAVGCRVMYNKGIGCHSGGGKKMKRKKRKPAIGSSAVGGRFYVEVSG